MRDFSALLNPRSVAVIGASSTLTSLAGRPVKNLLDSGVDIDIYPINTKRDEIAGLKCYPDVASLPVAPDVALILTPAASVPALLEQAGQRGIKAAIVITAGFAEMGSTEAQDELAQIARRYEMLLLGPNTIGVHDYRRGLPLSFVWFGRTPQSDAGSVAMVTQSGSAMAALCDRLLDEGLPLGHGVATGNEADLSVADLLHHFATDDEVKVVATVFEGIQDGPRFLEAVEKLRRAGKPVIALKLGRTVSGSKMTESHTGSLAGEYATISAVLRQHGVIEVDDVDDMGPTIAAALAGKFPEGDRIAAISSSGAATVICADRADELGMRLPEFSEHAQALIAPYLPSFSNGAHNPLDLTAQAMEHRFAMADILEIALAEEGLDAVVVGTPSGTGQKGIETADRLGEIARATNKPFTSFIFSGAEAEAPRARQRSHGIYPFNSPGKAVEALERLSRFGRARKRLDHRSEPSAEMQTSSLPSGRAESDVLRWLGDHGVPVIVQDTAATAEEAVAAAERQGYPVVLKIDSPDIAHKTEIGGVALNITDAAGVEDAFERLIASARAAMPDARLDGVTVAPMVEVAYELIVGIHRDPTFGLVVALGIGGIWAEVIDDVAIRALPVGDDDVAEMIDGLRGAAILRGARGFPAVDESELARVVTTLSRLAQNNAAALRGLDVNPIAVTTDGRIVVLDAALYA